jgi:hypothetical protein
VQLVRFLAVEGAATEPDYEIDRGGAGTRCFASAAEWLLAP